jgi:hypothetical protein
MSHMTRRCWRDNAITNNNQQQKVLTEWVVPTVSLDSFLLVLRFIKKLTILLVNSCHLILITREKGSRIFINFVR